MDRPDVLSLQAAKKGKDLGPPWKSLKAAHFSFVAELFALYPEDTHFYFLARDAEYLYDVARLVTRDSARSGRVHLLNVSHASMRDGNLKGYLQENGISEESLAAGRKAIFIDTGFSGTIPGAIAEGFSKEARARLKTHLIASSNPHHPSSRAFLVHLNPSVNESEVDRMHGSIATYEHMTRYTGHSSSYVYVVDRYHPISRAIRTSDDGSIDKKRNRQIMRDLVAEWQKPGTKARFKEERKQMKRLLRLLTSADDEARATLAAELERKKNTPQGRLLEAQVRDALDAQKNDIFRAKMTLEDLGLKAASDDSSPAPKRKELIAKYPEWSAVLENPDDEIPRLFKDENWQMIGNLIGANADAEISRLLVDSLYDGVATGIKKDLQVFMVKTCDEETRQYLARNFFTEPYTQGMEDILTLLIETGDAETWQNLAHFTFPQPHMRRMTAPLRLLIKKDDILTRQYLVGYTFPQPHTQKMEDLLTLLIEISDKPVWEHFAMYSFPQPHVQAMKGPTRLLMEKGDSEILYILSESAHLDTPEHRILRGSRQIPSHQRREWMKAELAKLKSPAKKAAQPIPAALRSPPTAPAVRCENLFGQAGS